MAGLIALHRRAHLFGKAARLLNITRVDFLALLRARGIAYINYTSDELAEEFAAVENLNEQQHTAMTAAP